MLQFLSANLPIVISLLIGIGLLVLEAFLPGFGVAGVSGILLEIVAVVITYLRHGAMAAVGVMLVCLSIIAIAISMSLRSAAKGRLSKSKMILSNTEDNKAGYVASDDLKVFLGREGVTTTVLRPTGMAEFDDVKLNVISEGEFIPANTRVRITRVEGSRLLVQKI